jgi:hypothetical protein
MKFFYVFWSRLDQFLVTPGPKMALVTPPTKKYSALFLSPKLLVTGVEERQIRSFFEH